jgi:hypothetical protein
MSPGRGVRRREEIVEDSSNPKKGKSELLDRLQKGSFPPAAVAGALVSFASAALGVQQKSTADPALVQIGIEGPKVSNAVVPHFEIEYSQILNLKPLKFQRSLAGIAVGPSDRIYALGDGEVRIFEPDGTRVRSWKAPEQSSCIAIGTDKRICIGVNSRVQFFDVAGNQKDGFNAGDSGRPADITAIKILSKGILVADAAAKCIHRYDFAGKRLGEIGTQNKTRGFMLPNRSLDIDVDAKGVVIAADSGRHRVSSWTMDGAPTGHFGKFGVMNAEDFVGCCNPVNLAFSPDGRIVTAEKVLARVKVYDAAGKLLALIGPEHFDPKCTRLHLAVDSKKRILVADPVRLEIKIFSANAKSGGRENV